MQGQPCRFNETIVSNYFQPHPWLRNQHIQTLWSRFTNYQANTHLYWQELTLPDGDFIDLAWTHAPDRLKTNPAPLLIIFHGLEGSARSAYVDQLLHAAKQQGWPAVVMHFRGCSGRANRTARAYHSGETNDARFFMQYLATHLPHTTFFAVGYSLGGSVLTKLLAESPELPIQAASIVSTPLALAASAQRINRGISRLYRNHLLNCLKQKTLAKLDLGLLQPYLSVTERQLLTIRDFYTFDQLITAPLHGFSSADDYYQKCSGLQFLGQLQTPLLILHAQDDPFTCRASIPHRNCLSPQVHYELYPHGGHVGFIERNQGKAQPWLPKRLLHWFNHHFEG